MTRPPPELLPSDQENSQENINLAVRIHTHADHNPVAVALLLLIILKRPIRMITLSSNSLHSLSIFHLYFHFYCLRCKYFCGQHIFLVSKLPLRCDDHIVTGHWGLGAGVVRVRMSGPRTRPSVRVSPTRPRPELTQMTDKQTPHLGTSTLRALNSYCYNPGCHHFFTLFLKAL